MFDAKHENENRINTSNNDLSVCRDCVYPFHLPCCVWDQSSHEWVTVPNAVSPACVIGLLLSDANSLVQ